MKSVPLLTVLGAVTLLTSVSVFAQPANKAADSPYAIEACKTGCLVYNDHGGKIYTGPLVKFYRVCTFNVFSAEITVDDQTVKVPATNFGVRGCVDVGGKTIVLVSGDVVAGLLP